jgi:hypothetical protein
MKRFKCSCWLVAGFLVLAGVGAASLSVMKDDNVVVKAANNDVYTFTDTSGSYDTSWSFATAQNSSTTKPAILTSGYLRLYQSSAGNGGSITISPSAGNTALLMTKISFNCDSSPEIVAKYGSTKADTAISGAAISDSVYTYSNASGFRYFYLQNAAKTKTRLDLVNMTITYSSGDAYTTDLAVSPSTVSLTSGAAIEKSSFTVTAKVNGAAASSYSNYSAAIGTIESGTFTKTSDLVFGTTTAQASFNGSYIRFTAGEPTTAGGSTYSTADVLISVTIPSITIKTTATDFTFSGGNLPDSWDGVGNATFASTKTAFKKADDYFEALNLVPSVATDTIYRLNVQVYSVVNSGTDTDTITVQGYKSGVAISSAAATFSPYYASATSAVAIDNACTDANSKSVSIAGSGLNGVRLSIKERKANWIVTKVKVSYAVETDQDKAETFATNFLSATSVCDATGATNNITDAIWTAQSDAYALLSDAVKTLLKAATPNAGGTVLEQFMARYTYIVGKYSNTNFLGITVAPARVEMTLAKNSTNVALIVVASLLAITFGAYFLIRRKKSAQ